MRAPLQSTALLLGSALAAGAAGLPEAGVSRDLARDRARMISDVTYRLSVTLKKQAPAMPGHAAIGFVLAAAGPVVLDFRDGAASNLRVNGAPAPISRRNGHIIVPGGHLKAGLNRIDLDFESTIAQANRAITRFNDPQDGSEYLYTLFVPMDADQAFPCFDQPDLKARFTLHVTAPPDWVVISNFPMQAPRQFEKTKPISTYLFAFAAGPFQMLKGPAGEIPLRLFVRKSMLSRAKEEWAAVAATARDGMTRMSAFFARPFPFPKYDQVLIPGFPYGGMEHAGATFLNEDTVLFRSVPTVNDFNRRSLTVLHELAHQWFGDLVTMRWFDDLWLKEGFAQFMAYHTQAEMEAPGPVWKRFYESIKPLAYRIDGTRGTTPIYQQIANLKDAKSAYGAIVYQKAPSLLRLLNFKVGEAPFREGIRIFLREHAFSNAGWSDLIAALSRASSTNLGPWADAWIQQRGMPQVEVSWACSGRHVSAFLISQSDPLGEHHVWPIQTQILLGYNKSPPVRFSAVLNGSSAAIPEAVGKPCPDYVFANDEDHAYGRFLLDPRSQTAILAQLPRISDPFLRALLWGAVWDNMRESRMPPLSYADLALESLPSEKDAESAGSILSRLGATFTLYLSDSQRASITPQLEDLLIRQMTAAPTADLRITYFRTLTALAGTARARGVLKELLAGRTAIPGVPLKQRDRWNLIAALVAQGDPSASALYSAETRRDQSDDGRKYSFVARAGEPAAKTKSEYFSKYLTQSGLQEDWIVASLPRFNHWSQTALTAQYLKPALDALPQMKREHKIFFVIDWLGSFVDTRHTSAALKTVDDFLASNTADADLKLKALEVRDELARTVRIRADQRSR